MEKRPPEAGVLEGIDDVPWADLGACHDAATVPALFREVAAGTRRSLVAADELLQTVWYQGSVFEATIPACRYVARLAASDLRPDVRTRLISYLLLFGEGTTFVEPAGGRRYLDETEFAARLETETRIAEEVRRLVNHATDLLLTQLDTAPRSVQEALLGLAYLGTQPLPAKTLTALRGIADTVSSDKATAAQLILDHLDQRPLRIELLEREWRDLSDGDEMLDRAHRGLFGEQDWKTLVSEMAGRLCATPLDRDGLWARAHLHDNAALLSIDEEDGPLPDGKHCVRADAEGQWQVFYSDGREASYVTAYGSETSACEHAWLRIQNSPGRWNAAEHQRFQEALIAARVEGSRPPPSAAEQRELEQSARRVAALRGLSWLMTFRQVRPTGADAFDVQSVSGYLSYALSAGSAYPDGYMPLLEFWMVAVSADETCDDELRLATRLAHEALGPTLPSNRSRYTPDPNKAADRRRRAEAKMRKWLEAR